uniref:Uncharacterized protein n=1 Tax=Octopus bimaculoides TaxID=37653 RepID=A0A0L8GDR8_OCTBM
MCSSIIISISILGKTLLQIITSKEQCIPLVQNGLKRVGRTIMTIFIQILSRGTNKNQPQMILFVVVVDS